MVKARVKSIKIDGNDYTPVHVRLKEFRKEYPKGTVTTHIVDVNEKFVIMKACILIESDTGYVEIASGTAMELISKNAGDVNYDSYIENCETSAVGRALGFAGYGINSGIASREEVMGRLGVEDKSPSKGDQLNKIVGG